MTNSQNTPTTTTIRLPLPMGNLIYSQLNTDYYPWPEIKRDLLKHQNAESSFILDIQQDERWARFVWLKGKLLGSMGGGGSEVALDAAMLGMPKASASLVEVAPEIANITWSCFRIKPRKLEIAWPAVKEELVKSRFHGVLIGELNLSYWDSGREVEGVLPRDGVACIAIGSGHTLDRSDVINFWSEVIAITFLANSEFAEAWKRASIKFATRHPSLDPFIDEISISGGRLRVASDVSMQELVPAMLDAYKASLKSLNMSIESIPLNKLHKHSFWRNSGIGAIQ